jgi:hypothetical protein
MTSPEGDVNIVALSLHVDSKRLSSASFNIMRSVVEIDKPKLPVAILAWVVHEMGMRIPIFFIQLAYLVPPVITSGDAVSCSLFQVHVTHRAAIRSIFSGRNAGAFPKLYSSLYALVSSPLNATLAEPTVNSPTQNQLAAVFTILVINARASRGPFHETSFDTSSSQSTSLQSIPNPYAFLFDPRSSRSLD